jgi:NADPH:quinone reductase-like Zn-dependent oxidoreductase
MHAAGIERFGNEVRMLDRIASRRPADDEVVIRVYAAGVGNWDEFVRVGDWDVGRGPPLVLGVEAAGVVSAVGSAVTSFAVGDEVFTHPVPLRHQGAWAAQLVAPATSVARKPAGIAWDVAAAFPVPALTADQAVTAATVDPTDTWVLVHGAGGVTGGLAVQLAVARGAIVIATAGRTSAARVEGLGARVVVDYRDRNWPARVRDAVPRRSGVQAAVNAAPGGAAAAMQCVVDGGHLATITGDPPPEERGIRVSDVYVEADGARLDRLAKLLATGTLSLAVAANYPLANAADALRAVTSGQAGGAVVLTLDGEDPSAARSALIPGR